MLWLIIQGADECARAVLRASGEFPDHNGTTTHVARIAVWRHFSYPPAAKYRKRGAARRRAPPDRRREREENYRLQIHSYSCAEPLVSAGQRAPRLTVQSTAGSRHSLPPLV